MTPIKLETDLAIFLTHFEKIRTVLSKFLFICLFIQLFHTMNLYSQYGQQIISFDSKQLIVIVYDT